MMHSRAALIAKRQIMQANRAHWPDPITDMAQITQAQIRPQIRPASPSLDSTLICKRLNAGFAMKRC
jgi:hypothetical protein